MGFKNEEQFIDADDEFHKESNTYEEILLRQMQKCVEVLSKEVIGGYMKKTPSRGGITEVYVEDVRQVIINSVEILRVLLSPSLSKKEHKEKLKEIYSNIDKFKKEIKKRKISINGNEKIEVGKLKVIPVDSVVWKEFIEYKSQQYREMFETLIMIYNNKVSEDKAEEIE